VAGRHCPIPLETVPWADASAFNSGFSPTPKATAAPVVAEALMKVRRENWMLLRKLSIIVLCFFFVFITPPF
jgi:hypothetical protein